MARNSGNRAFLILFTSLIMVVGLITSLSQIGIGRLVTIVTESVSETAGEIGDRIVSGTGDAGSRPLAAGIAEFVENGDALSIPEGSTARMFEREGFLLAYDDDLRIALWVGYELTAEELEGLFPRTDSFRRDPQLGSDAPAGDSYAGSGYDRGHLVPAADLKWSEIAMQDGFLMSNITPQIPSLNRGPWRELEEAIRELARQEGALVIVAGPILGAREYARLPDAGTVIPEYYFKVVLDYRTPGLGAWGFILPNNDEQLEGRDFRQFLFTVDEVERFAGYDFFAPLPDETEEELEANLPPIF